MRNEKVQKLTLTALMAALSYVIFTFLQIKVTLPGGSATSFHLGNAVVVLAALLLGGVYGGIGDNTNHKLEKKCLWCSGDVYRVK